MAKRLARPTGTYVELEIPYGDEHSTPSPLDLFTLNLSITWPNWPDLAQLDFSNLGGNIHM